MYLCVFVYVRVCVCVDVLWIYGCFCAYRTPLTCTVFCCFFFFLIRPCKLERVGFILFIYLYFFLFIFRVSRMCYQMISDELTTTPLGTETAQNHFSTKAERMLLVTNATEYLSVVCVCLCIYVCLCV